MSLEDNIRRQRMNFSGAPMDRIRSSTAQNLIESMEFGITFAEAVAEMELALYTNRGDIREKWGLSDEEIEEAKEMGVHLAKISLGIQ